MSWQKKDDNFHDSPRVVEANLTYAELGMYDYAVGYSHRHLTDGIVPIDKLIYRIDWRAKQNLAEAVADARRLLQRLLDVCFFADLSNGSVQIVNYLSDYDSRESVEEGRRKLSEVRAESGRKGGLAKAANRTDQPVIQQASKPLAPVVALSSPLLTSPNRTSPNRMAGPQSQPIQSLTETHTHARPTLSSPQSAGAEPPTSAPLAVKRTRQREEWDVVRDRHEAEAVPIATAHELAAAAVAQLSVIEAAAEQERRANQREPIRFSPEIIEQFRAIDPNYRPDDSEIRLVDEVPDSGRTDTNARAEPVVLDLRRGAK